MAIKISGNTVIDDSQNITATGSGTFSNTVMRGTFSSGSDTARGSILGDGMVASQQPAGGQPTAIMWEGYYGTSVTSRIRAGGSATFAGDVTTAGVLPTYATATMPAGENASSWGLFTGRSDASTVTSQIKADGSASFASGAFLIDENGYIATNIKSPGIVELASNGDYSNPKIQLHSVTGSSYFAGDMGIGTLYPTEKLDVRGNVYIGDDIEVGGEGHFGSTSNYVKVDGAVNGVYIVESGVTSINLNKNGSAWFAGDVTTAGVITAAGGYALSQLTELT